MEEDPLSPSSCVTASSVPEPHQLSFKNSLSHRVGDILQDTVFEPWNLRTKRIMAFWHNTVAGPTSAKHPGNRKRKKLDKVKARAVCDKTMQHPRRRKRKRKRIASLNVVHFFDLSIPLAPNPYFAGFIDRVLGVKVMVALLCLFLSGCLFGLFRLGLCFVSGMR